MYNRLMFLLDRATANFHRRQSEKCSLIHYTHIRNEMRYLRVRECPQSDTQSLADKDRY